MKQVPSLPKGDDSDFWLDAKNEKYQPRGEKCSHYFEYLSAREIVCRCGIGYFVSLGTEVKNGHIYIHGSFVI